MAVGAFCGLGERVDDFVFGVVESAHYVGGDHHIAVHKLIGAVLDLGVIGD